MGIDPKIVSWKHCGPHVSPREFHRYLLERTEDDVVLDVRNLYESAIGRIDGAIRVPTRHFSEFPSVADELIETYQLRKKRRVLMYCTGGIRCT